jgi:hypothetical protein
MTSVLLLGMKVRPGVREPGRRIRNLSRSGDSTAHHYRARRLGVLIAAEQKTTHLVWDPSCTAFCLLETRLRGAEATTRIRERLSRIKNKGIHAVSPESLGFSITIVCDNRPDRPSTGSSLNFSPLLSHPRRDAPPLLEDMRGAGIPGQAFRKKIRSPVAETSTGHPRPPLPQGEVPTGSGG